MSANSAKGQRSGTLVMHYAGNCESCDWFEDGMDPAIRRHAKAHTKKTGHVTWVDAMTTTKYEPQQGSTKGEQHG